MAGKRGKTLGASFDGLAGAQLVRALGEHGATDILEAFWRYRNGEVAAEAAPAIFATGDQYLLGLVLDEILSPQLEQPAHQRILTAIGEHQPVLAKSDAERLGERLRDSSPLHPYYEPARSILLAWAVSQPGEVGESLTLGVIAHELSASEQANVRQAAYARCRDSERLLGAAAEGIAVELDQRASQQSWQQAAEFVEQACSERLSTPDAMHPIVRVLVHTAPNYFQGARQFAPTLQRLAAESAVEVVEARLSANLADSQGARAILALLPDIGPPQRRAMLWASAARTQQQLWPVLQQQTTVWDEAEWKRVLRALARPEPLYRPALAYVIGAAPIELTAELTRLVMAQVAREDELISTVGQRVRERLNVLGEGSDTRDAWVAAVHWPKQSDEEGIAKLSAIAGCVEASLHVRLLVRGYLAGKLPVDVAAGLIPSGEVARALTIVAAGSRGEWAAALAVAHPDEIGGAAGAVMAPADYDLDVVAALAPTRPDVSFAGVAAAWSQLEPEQKDTLLELLEEHGTEESVEALCTVILDDHRDNAKRRGRAARQIGALLEPGETLPDPVLDLLNSNLPDLRSAAVEAIERVKPREPELITRLHDVVDRGGAAAKAAANALDALTREFLARFTATSDKADLHELMPLLGAVGRADVLQPLFEYVGSNAVYDDATLHRQAATAIREAATRIDEVSGEHQEALVALIDGEEQETDLKARDDLSAALARFQLGDDAALQVLYDEINFNPNVSPDRLFQAEKDPLVRQLALYDRARNRGQDGWGAELAHLDNVAERLVRAAYLVSEGTSAAIVEQIKNDSRAPDYGNLITALASTKQLNGVQASCRVLHDARCNFSEIPHAGEQADADTMTTARQCFVKLAKVCVGTLKSRRASGQS